jgi:N-acetyl-gamma-glutamyl-phosphate reductase
VHTVLIDGHVGTTGLQIKQRLQTRSDIELIEVPEEVRKDSAGKKPFLNAADVVVLCLPDDAAREAVSLVDNPDTVVIDASTAHRTAEGWAYGLPELSPAHREAVVHATRITNPGCHATGFLAALYPLLQAGVVPPDYPVVAHSVTGYSGGGKKMIATYEQGRSEGDDLNASRPYALSLQHKHVPEMQAVAGLPHPPLFMPVLGDFYQGMVVTVPLTVRTLPRSVSLADVHEVLASHYEGQTFVKVVPLASEHHLDGPFLSPTACNGTNRLDLFVLGNQEQILVAARFDNLGKGASGAAVQNMNLVLGETEDTGLTT